MEPGNFDKNPLPRPGDRIVDKGQGSSTPTSYKGSRNTAGSGKPAGGAKPPSLVGRGGRTGNLSSD